MTPLRVANWADYNAGMVGDIQALTDPNDDRILGWDDSGGIAIAYDLSTGLTTSGTDLLVDTAVVPLLSASNTFTGNITISTIGPTIILNETDGDSGSLIACQDIGVARGYMGSSNATNGVITGSAEGDMLVRAESGGFLFSGNAGSTIHFKLSSAGVLTTPNASASEVGYKGMPVISMTGDDGVAASYAGKLIYYTGAGGHTLTIPANGSVAHPVGTVLGFFNNGSGSFSVAITTDTLIWVGTGSTSTRTVALYGYGSLTKIATTSWIISGVGIS
jgi:hypothetical protein